ncbi:hypothetical protein NDU88_002673 [Pleurodeles waltl]|uniref:Uncharacterized protein n=1 Tax=Pleurodeles waltl TaxID=8319 RepID=A0AAV7UW98_PLEWA|nr:hypothetical protein NDU88_002673 [Pleurodeles waltl]
MVGGRLRSALPPRCGVWRLISSAGGETGFLVVRRGLGRRAGHGPLCAVPGETWRAPGIVLIEERWEA